MPELHPYTDAEASANDALRTGDLDAARRALADLEAEKLGIGDKLEYELQHGTLAGYQEISFRRKRLAGLITKAKLRVVALQRAALDAAIRATETELVEHNAALGESVEAVAVAERALRDARYGADRARGYLLALHNRLDELRRRGADLDAARREIIGEPEPEREPEPEADWREIEPDALGEHIAEQRRTRLVFVGATGPRPEPEGT